LVSTLLILGMLVLIGPNRPFHRATELLNICKRGVAELPTTPELEIDTGLTVEPPRRPTTDGPGGRSIPVISALLVVALPSIMRKRYREEIADDPTEVDATRSFSYIARVLVRIPALRCVLRHADAAQGARQGLMVRPAMVGARRSASKTIAERQQRQADRRVVSEVDALNRRRLRLPA
jgi:hypothetical protein